MTAISAMAGRVLVNTPECPQPAAEAYLLLAAIELCRRSKVWHEVLAAASLISTDFPRAITPPTDGRVLKVLSIVVDGKAPALEEVGVRNAEQSTNDWRTATGTPEQFIEMPRGTVFVLPLPSAAMSFVMTVAYEPTETATTIPDAIYQEYSSAIISGAIYMLATIPGKPWTSGDLALLHKRLFEDGIQAASRELHQHYTLPAMFSSASPI